jgi:hypothetical protein
MFGSAPAAPQARSPRLTPPPRSLTGSRLPASGCRWAAWSPDLSYAPGCPPGCGCRSLVAGRSPVGRDVRRDVRMSPSARARVRKHLPLSCTVGSRRADRLPMARRGSDLGQAPAAAWRAGLSDARTGRHPVWVHRPAPFSPTRSLSLRCSLLAPSSLAPPPPSSSPWPVEQSPRLAGRTSDRAAAPVSPGPPWVPTASLAAAGRSSVAVAGTPITIAWVSAATCCAVVTLASAVCSRVHIAFHRSRSVGDGSCTTSM